MTPGKTMSVDVILFDADGVIQRPLAERHGAWRDVLGSERDPGGFLAAVFAAERPALEGHGDFVESLSGLVAEWNCIGTLAEALEAWTMIEVDTAITEVVKTLRRDGVRCHLATNQEPHRARYMSDTLGYAELFDREFYSCRMGVMKPAVTYFRAIVRELDVSARNVLFLDDHQANVDSAREAGLHAATFTLEAGPRELVRTLGAFGIHVG
jgi:HAD superfamily hydrolase (TIGR01509 family)